MTSRRTLGGIIHTYQKFDPHNFPSPTAEPPDLVSHAFEHMLAYGDLRELTDEELARAIRLDPSQIAGLGPSLEMLRGMLLERKRKILATYETEQAQAAARKEFHGSAASVHPPKPLADRFKRAVAEEQLRELERLWYHTADDRDHFARQLMRLVARLGDKYQVNELAAKYAFTGRTPMTVPKGWKSRKSWKRSIGCWRSLEEAAKTAQIGIIDLEQLSQFTDPQEVERLETLQRRVEELMRQIAEQQGLERGKEGYRLTPKAYRLFQGRLLERIFSQLEASRSGRHQGPVVGEGAVELQQTKAYEFGDSVANMDLAGSFTNALVRGGPACRSDSSRKTSKSIARAIRQNAPRWCWPTCRARCATTASTFTSNGWPALDGLVRREYPGDSLQFIEMYTFAKRRAVGEIAALMPKAVTVFDPVVRLSADMSREDISEYYIPPLHEHSARLATGPAIAVDRRHPQPANHPHHRRPAHRPF